MRHAVRVIHAPDKSGSTADYLSAERKYYSKRASFGAAIPILALPRPRSIPRLPSLDDLTDCFAQRLHRVHFQIVLTKGVRFEMVEPFPNRAITTQPFSALNFIGGSVNPNPENIERGQQFRQFIRPALLLDDVLHEKIVSRSSKGSNRSMESLKKSPSTSRASLQLKRTKARIGQLIRSKVTKLRLQRWPQSRHKS
jgi:hypothetical protein